MSPEELLLEWKERYGYIYVTEINGNEFVYRLLGYQEYLLLEQQTEDTIQMDEKIAKLCVLDPIIEDWDEDIYAGYSSTLGQLIREDSLITPKEDGSTDMKALIAEKKEDISSRFLLQMPLIIKRCFQEYGIEEIERMNLNKQIELYAKALWMLENFEGLKMEFDEE